MNPTVYKVGIIGCANIAIRSLLPAFFSSDRFVIAAIASRNLDKAIDLAVMYSCRAYGSYEELLLDNEIDIIYLPLPTGLHYEWILKSLHKGKHVISEKSLATSFQEVNRLTELATEKNLLLFENFQFRFHSQHQWVKELLQRNELGEIRCFRSSFGFPPFLDSHNIRYSKDLGGGSLLDAGAYTLKALQVVLPNYFFELKAASLYQPCCSEVDLWGGVYLDCKEGVVAELSFGFDNYYQCNYEIWGNKGKLIVTRAFTAPANLKPIVILEKQDCRQEIPLPEDDHFGSMLRYVATCLDTGCYAEENKRNLQQALYIEKVKAYCYGE